MKGWSLRCRGIRSPPQNIVKEQLTRKIFRDKDLASPIVSDRMLSVSPEGLRCECARCHCALLVARVKVVRHIGVNFGVEKLMAVLLSRAIHLSRAWSDNNLLTQSSVRTRNSRSTEPSLDTFSKSQRSQIMRSVRSKGTAPERKCERLLRSLKLRFRRHAKELPGQPDFVLKASRLVLFVHGCFWHAHKGCKSATLPTSNVEYWRRKIERNRKRDRRVRDALRKAGWRTAVIWECRLRNAGSVASRLSKLANSGRRK